MTQDIEVSIETVVNFVNGKHAAVMIGGKFAILTETLNPNTLHPEVQFSTVTDLKHFYKNQKIVLEDDEGKKKLVDQIAVWMEHPARRTYDGIVFTPGHAPNGYYNLWKGFAVEPQQGDCSLYFEHILNNICNGNSDHYQWLLDWMADAVQNPEKRPGTAVALRGDQGTGKGVFANTFGSLFGPHFIPVSGQHRLTGKFNNHLKTGLLVFVDEGFWAGDRKDTGILKAMVTEDIHMIEAKFQDAIPLKNHLRVVIASNSNWVVPAGPLERRFFVTDVSNAHIQDKAYFKAISDQMKSGGQSALMYELLNRQIESDLRTIPRTQALFDQMVNTMGSFQKWWLACLYQGEVCAGSDWPESCPVSSVYESYKECCKEKGFRHPDHEVSFGKKMKRFCPGIYKKQEYLTTGRPYFYHFPNLETARNSFEQLIGIEIIWDDDFIPF
jgi:hypothetical protein